jgi:hypothetical protein
VCIVHRSASSRSLWLTKAEGQHWCSQAETCSLAATAAMATQARQTGRGHALGDNPHAAATRAPCPAHAETTNIVPTAGPMRVRGCVPTRAAREERQGTRPLPPPAPPGAPAAVPACRHLSKIFVTGGGRGPFPATAWAQGRQFNGAPFPATAWAEGGQFNGPPSPHRRHHAPQSAHGLRRRPMGGRRRVGTGDGTEYA